MAKKAKGNRVQVILECTETLQKIERIQLKDWNLRNTTQS